MSEFYSELKELRESQNIDLDEIHSRTKINLEYLKAIESGQFNILPTPYVRLFLKAYVSEIGGDAEEALHQLDLLQGRKVGRRVTKKTDESKTESGSDDQSKKSINLSRPPTKVREDLIKGGVLLIIFLFAIFIIRQINNERSPVSIQDGEIVRLADPEAVTQDQLVNDYVEAVSQTIAMPVVPPLKLKIVATDRIWYSMAADTTNKQSGFLSSGEEKSLSFEDQIHVLLRQTADVLMYINGIEVEELGNFQHPAEILYFAEPNTITVKHYLPQR